jgi:hypothetical protein
MSSLFSVRRAQRTTSARESSPRSGRRIAVILAGTAALSVIAACHGTTTSSAPTGTSPAAAASSSSSSRGAPVTPAATPSSDPAAALARWGLKGYPLVSKLGDTLGALVKADRDHDRGALVAACGRLGLDVKALQSVLPTPDARLTSLLRSGLNDFASSVTSCLAGDFRKSATQESAGNAVLGQVHDREMQIVGG